ncbi:hypothetical protein ALC53_08561, partial [Atta colombica]
PFRSLSLKESRLRRSGEIPAILGIEAGAISTSKSISEEWNGENGDDGRNGNGKRRLPREVLTMYKTNINRKGKGGEERRGELAQRAEESKEDGFHSVVTQV